jgi:type IV pilus assembly protein PilB
MAETATGAKDKEAPNKRKPLGQRLLESGLITRAQLDLALREQKRLGIYLGDALETLGFVTQDVIASMLAEETAAQMVDVKAAVIDQELLDLVPYDLAKKHKLIPLGRDGDTLSVAMADTLNVVAVDAVEQISGLMVDVVTAAEQDILEAIEHHYAQSGSIEDTMDKILNRGAEDIGEDAGEEAPMIRLMDQIIALAVKNRATDIHIEPDEKIVRIRMRVDGLLTQQVLMPKPLQSALTARLKIMANLNVTEKRIPQDGRVGFQLGLRKIDLRVSTLPTVFGENLVIRVLDKGGMALTLPSLGFSKRDEDLFGETLTHPHGVILVTGPTGSGKTSTLYAALSIVNTVDRSIFTLEDPIEYQMPVVRQTQVRSEIGMTFASGLRALLRQDPDVIMVGEIRDAETAELAVRAALTGHLVFSTLHTNDAIGAIPRLIDMGIEPYLLTSALACVVGQRLVRRICDECKEPEPEPQKILDGLDVNIKFPPDREIKLWRGVGCKACNGSGYRGRLGIYEVLKVDEKLHDGILNGVSPIEMKRVAREGGYRSMVEDGIIKAAQGVTTIREVLRVIK